MNACWSKKSGVSNPSERYSKWITFHDNRHVIDHQAKLRATTTVVLLSSFDENQLTMPQYKSRIFWGKHLQHTLFSDHYPLTGTVLFYRFDWHLIGLNQSHKTVGKRTTNLRKIFGNLWKFDRDLKIGLALIYGLCIICLPPPLVNGDWLSSLWSWLPICFRSLDKVTSALFFSTAFEKLKKTCFTH